MATSQNLDLKKLLPSAIRNELLDGLVSNMFNRFVSEEESVLVNGRVGVSIQGDTNIVSSSFDRQVNALVPALYLKNGVEESVFTFEDFINKMTSLDVDVVGMHEWMAEEYFNYIAPINIDKFINYANYVWINPTEAGPSWNPTNKPEYYVIARPGISDSIKNAVKVATTTNINLWANDRPTETFTIQFISSSAFVLSSNVGLVTSSVTTLTSPAAGGVTPVSIYAGSLPLVSFVIAVGTLPFSSGDTLSLTITYFTSNILTSLTAVSSVGKGAIGSVQTLSPMMSIDGVQIAVGDRVLVKDQTNSSENGIYVVTLDSQWHRAIDATDASVMQTGSIVFSTAGNTNGGKTFKSSGTLGTDATFAIDATAIDGLSPLNDWQTLNQWIHADDVQSLPNYASITTVQATHPIIEYKNSIELNSYYDADGNPNVSSTIINARQRKFRLNQIPQFNLYRYDGTHQGTTSGIFFYVEDPDYTTDIVLERRVKTTADADFIFGLGIKDTEGRLLYFKDGTSFKSVWQGSVTAPRAGPAIFSGGADKGTLTVSGLTPKADSQSWTATVASATTFTIHGLRSGTVGIATVGVPFSCDDFTDLLITAGTRPYETGESFKFNVLAPLAPRFVKEAADGSIINYPGGAIADPADGVIDGAWMAPARMFQNLDRETATEITFGNYLNHARSILKHQDGFTGSSFGINNSRTLVVDPTLGGTIREFGSNFPLLASMLIQPEISPLSVLEFSQQQYNVALASIDQFILNELPTYLTNNSRILSSAISPTSPDILALMSHFETIRGTDQNLKMIFSDTTAGVTYWPATLPMIGLLPPVVPGISFDQQLGIDVIVHHDGHISPISAKNAALDRTMVQTVVPRSDGTSSAGVVSSTTPMTPYAGQLWIDTSTSDFNIYIFNVISDLSSEPVGAAGDYWYNKAANALFEFNPANSTWAPVSLSLIPSLWIPFNTSAIRNSLLLAIEAKLYDSVHAKQDVNVDLYAAASSSYSEIELARFAAKYGYDTYAPDYSASDAFTWNYHLALNGKARWYDVYTDYFATQGVLPTCRPNLEPWKLMGLATKPADWDSNYKSTITGLAPSIAVDYATDAPITPPLIGLPTVDGTVIPNGASLLMTGQADSRQNGIWLVSTGGWSRAANPLFQGVAVSILSGSFATTVWTLTTTDPIIEGITPVTFEQIRTWKKSMWLVIKAAHPTMKLGVNINTDALLPPYVSGSLFASGEALLTITPAGISDVYTFGQHGPIETIWIKSLEYGYGLARSYFRLQPLKFLDKTWGETYFKTGDNVRVERNLMAPLPVASFLLHGEKLNIINSYTPAQISKNISIPAASPITWTGAATVKFVVTHTADNITWFSAYVNGIFQQFVQEGVAFSLTAAGAVFSNVVIDDLGVPFDLQDTITFTFNADVVDPSYVPPVTAVQPLGCEDCVADGAVIVAASASIPMVKVPYTVAFSSSNIKIFKGVGQWFTNLLRFNSIDTTISPAALAYRGWSIKLAHQLGVLIRPETLTVNTTQGNLPTTAYNVVLKKSANTSSKWISGLRIQLVQIGSRQVDASGKLVINSNGNFQPVGGADNWIFRVEAYNAQHPILERYVLDTTAEFETFYALQQEHTSLAWKHNLKHLSIESTSVPRSITGLQNVIDFIYGYTDRLSDLGWSISPDSPIVDAKTGRTLTWQLEIEKFIDRVYDGMEVGEGYILNPFMSRLQLNTPVGLMSKYSDANFIDEYSTQAAYDVTGTVIPMDSIYVVRTDESAITYSQTPIFSAHVFTDEYEHVILMNQKFSDETNSAVIFDTFLGLRITTAFLSYIRQSESYRKPTFGGFYLSGNTVKRNISSSIDAIGSYYDADQTFYDPTTANHALSLLGFVKKDYFGGVNSNDTTQFNFWRGLIQAKGTNMAINAFVNYKKFIDASTDEYWAYKLATFGDSRERTFPEIKINPSDVTQKFARLQFYSADDTTYDPLPLYTQIENSDDTYWYSIDDLGTGMKFEAAPLSEVITATGAGYYSLKNIYHNGDGMSPTVTGGATIVNANLIKVPAAGTYTVTGHTWNNPTKHSPVKLFDYVENTLVDEIGLWHPAIGIHAYAPLEIVNMISNDDPASYNYTTKITDNVQYKVLKPWGQREVGRVFWDTSNLAYIPYYDATVFPSRDVRHARWGSLAEYASIDLYEWTESSVHPSAYNALAISQEGDSSIDDSIKASGKVALAKFYERDRIINAKPVAWSYVPTGLANGHAGNTAFGYETNTDVWISGNVLIADKGTTAEANLISGRSFSAWDKVNAKPIGELAIGANISWTIGSTSSAADGGILPSALSLGLIVGGLFGTRIGTITLDTFNDGTDYVRLSDSTGFSQDIEITAANDVDTLKLFKFDTFGLMLSVQVQPGTNIAGILQLINASRCDIIIREMVDFAVTVPFKVDPGTFLSNNTSDSLIYTSDYGWITWAIPTQAQLDADLLAPYNAWLPFVGEEVPVNPTPAVIAAMKDATTSLTLKSGNVINRYTTTWGNWKDLTNEKTPAISDGTSLVSFTAVDVIDSNRLSIYANGIQVNPDGYVITENSVKLVNTLPEGTTVIMLNRAYQPTAKELAFDPAVADDVTIQVQYKSDYQYTQLEVKDEQGNTTGMKYYFWVQDKTIPQLNKSMSLSQAASLLKSGASRYMLFSRLQSGGAYDSFAISGLNTLITKNDSYKLRMLRDFTLRDDPEELNLKNVHTEWALIRKGQSGKIPASLWATLTDAVAGQDIVGNKLPSQARIDYDNRNNTRTRFGFKTGQIFADTTLLRASITNSILNTNLSLNLAGKKIPDYITALDFNNSEKWFADAAASRATMDLIWSSARAVQVNEVFFDTLDDALSNNYEFSDLFKTSFITVSSTSIVEGITQSEQPDELY